MRSDKAEPWPRRSVYRRHRAAAIASPPQLSRSAAAFPASVTSYRTSLMLTEASVSQPNATRRRYFWRSILPAVYFLPPVEAILRINSRSIGSTNVVTISSPSVRPAGGSGFLPAIDAHFPKLFWPFKEPPLSISRFLNWSRSVD